MSSVDDRVVNMTFNNKQFTQGVTDTKRHLTDLEKTLASTAKSKGLSAMGSSVDGVKSKFSALQVAGVAAIATVASKATAAGLQMVKSLTLGPVIAGFQEYQTNLNSIQTIMSNTGKSVKVVNSYLDQLNHYADKTVYNFSEMAKNIGTFTAAGVALEPAVASIKGIANLAALSGSNSQQASTAMYQLSQAIAAGKVGLQDWNSVVNAGMGGKIFQQALARTAQNMGSLTDGAIKLEGPMKKITINGNSFRESIMAKPGQESWLSGEALVETLKQISGGFSDAELKAKGYTDAQIKEIQKLAKTAFNAATQIKTLPQLFQVVQESIGSMWANAFRIILGDFNQSKKLWMAVGDTIIGPGGILTKIQDRFIHVLERWAELGGRSELIDAFGNIFKAIGRILSAFGGAWSDIFGGGATGKDLFNLTKGFEAFTNALIPSKDTVEALRTILAGFFAVAHVGWEVLKGLVGAVTSFLGAIFQNSGGARKGVLDIAAALSEGRILIDQWITQGGKLADTLSTIGRVAGEFIAPLIQGISKVVEAFGNLATGGGFEGFIKPFNEARILFADFASDITTGLGKLFSPIEEVSDFFWDLTVKIEAFESSLRNASEPVDGISSKLSKLADIDILSGTFEKLKSSATDAASGISIGFDGVSFSTDNAKESVESAYASMSGGTADAAARSAEVLGKAAEGSSSIFSTLGDILSAVWPIIKTAASAIGNAIGEIISKLPDFAALFKNFDAIEWASLVNAAFSGALILTLRNFIKSFADIGPAISGSFDQLTNTLKTMQNAVKAELIKAIAIGVALLVASLVALSLIKMPALQKGIGGLAAVMALMVGAMYALDKIGGGTLFKGKIGTALGQLNLNLISLASTMVILSAAMVGFALALAILSRIDTEDLAKGIGALAATLIIMTGAMFVFSKMQGSVLAASTSLGIMAGAMLILAAAVAAFGLLPMGVLEQGLGGMAVGLALITGSLFILSKNTAGIIGAGAAMVFMATAMNIMVGAITALGILPWDIVQQGLIAVAFGIAIMSASLLVLSGNAVGVMGAAGAMVLLAAALNMLVPVIVTLGSLPWQVVARGLGFVAAALAILLLAGIGAGAVAPGLLVLALAVGALGVAAALAGVGMLAFGTGFALMAAAGVAGVAVLVAAFKAFIALLPSIAVQLAAAWTAFLKAIAAASPKIRAALGTIIKNMLGTVRDAIPEVGKLFTQFINTGLEVLNKSAPRFIETAFKLIDAFLKSADRHIPSITKSAISLVTKFINTLADNVGKLADAGANLIVKTINGIADAIDAHQGELRTAGLNLAGSIIDGITGGLLTTGMDAVQGALSKLASLVPDKLKGFLGANSPAKKLIPVGVTIGEGMARGIKDSTGVAVSAATTMADAIISSVNGVIDAGVMSAQQGARTQMGVAARAQAVADIGDKGANAAENRATQLQRKANKVPGKDKARKKAAEKKARKATNAAEAKRRAADKLQVIADRQQAAADAAVQRVQDARAFASADALGRAQMKDDLSVELAARSQAMLEKSNAEALEAEKLRKTNKKAAEKMLAQSKKDAEAARTLAAQAQQANTEALAYYNQARAELSAAVRERIAGIRQEAADREKEREWEKAYNLASTQGKADMMAAKAAENQAKADAAAAAASNALAQAESLADSDPEAANKLLDFAEEQSNIAQNAADQAQDNRDQAAQLVQQAAQEAAAGATTTTGEGGVTIINPSRTALEDAAKEVDRYTSSLMQAQEAAAAGASVVQFVQNNTSPVALSPSEIYRQSKNLLSAHEVKMGAN